MPVQWFYISYLLFSFIFCFSFRPNLNKLGILLQLHVCCKFILFLKAMIEVNESVLYAGLRREAD